ncbi:MAG: hypothetical protein O8C61_05530 [Candidatus Methanoperedens sp.]|nr:hypothetical protein [Candidatus Methanoperedens sp.]
MTSDRVLIQPQFQVIDVDCQVYGKISNQKLYVCENFQYDNSKPEIVYIEKRAGNWHKRFFMRIGTKIPLDEKKEIVSRPAADFDDLTRAIYDLVYRVYVEHNMKSLLLFVFSRINHRNGYSQETVFKRIMSMIADGYLIKSMTGKMVELSPPSDLLTISEVREIGKRKVLA